ncbi:MAG: diaminopimelate decarboxylase [Fidelibacterota bacterium]
MPSHPLLPLVENGKIFHQLRETYSTPLYVYSGDRIKENLARLDKSLRDNFHSYHICYALKANTNPHLIRFMKDNLPGLGGDCSSPGELLAAQKSGINPRECIFTGNYESSDDLQAAFEQGAVINLDDITSLDRLLEIGTPDMVSFRLNPGFGKGRFAQITTAGNKAKFGIPKEFIVAAYEKAQAAGIKQFGLQCMSGSGVLDDDYFPTLLKAVLTTASEISDQLGIRLSFISLGGGFGIPYMDSEPIFDIETVFKHLADIFYEQYPDREQAPSFWIEPGKYIIGDAGILLATVTGLKNSYRRFVGLDAGMETLMRPALYQAYHRIYVVNKPAGPITQTVDITGRICENTDRLATDRAFPSTKVGDLIAIMDTGAYGFSMSHQFNNRPRPAEVLLTGQQDHLIRRRETLQDLFALCDI